MINPIYQIHCRSLIRNVEQNIKNQNGRYKRVGNIANYELIYSFSLKMSIFKDADDIVIEI